MEKMINILFFFIYLVAGITGHRIDSMRSKVKEDLDIERELKLINKAPIKSIHTKFGDLVDCIDIKKQPVFDHPLLTNHKLQTKPSFENIIKKTNVKNSSTKAIFGIEREQCPSGTVPIKRTTHDDLIRAKSYYSNFSELTPGTHIAQVTLVSDPDFGPYYGVEGTNSVYSVKVEKDQSSTSMIWVQNGPNGDRSLIGIGWHTGGSKKGGCYNLQCSGFVQTSKKIYLGVPLSNTSIINGRMLEIKLSINQDPTTKNWWLSNENEHIGYYPASLFSNLPYADQVGWGGRTTTSVGAPNPPMGSGLFPDNIFTHACYFKNVTYRNKFGQSFGPPDVLTKAFFDEPHCYSAEYYGDEDKLVGYSLQFGGPGGECGG
ncbi:uncharacterized protein [Medicago truncatula]|uniref:uncharacterized protein n=1 Tax=Medicago truncatula TaxID=3880 RepID=UPI001966FFB6|nr:uncharacterized protein LOC11435381 [Medicago truncatula]